MYLDSSVLVKFYVREADTPACVGILAGQPMASSELAYGELASALLQKERGGHITPQIRAAAWAAFLGDIAEQSIHLLELNGDTVRAAAEIMRMLHPRVPLRTLDAIHLATFQCTIAGPLFTKDTRMLAAAKLLGFATVE